MPTLSLGALRSTLIQESIKLPSPTSWGGIESSCWGRKSSGEEGKGEGRREGDGKKESGREEAKGRGSKEGRREGKKGREAEVKK